MKFGVLIAFVGILFGLTSCIEIVDDLSLNNDGTGTLNYNVNLSGSKVKINSIFALDSLDGKKVPSKEEVRNKIWAFKEKFEVEPGIENVTLEMDLENFLIKLKVDFDNVYNLQKAIKRTIAEMSKSNKEWFDEDFFWLNWKDNKLIRSIPEVKNEKVKSLKNDEMELLKQGNYISITRFESPVQSCANPKAIISKNKLAVMVRTDALSLSQNLSLLENEIVLVKEPAKKVNNHE